MNSNSSTHTPTDPSRAIPNEAAAVPHSAATAAILNSAAAPLFCRGVRGATTVSENSRDEILTATRQLLALMIRLNDIQSEDVASAIFSTTVDVDAEFPALAARQLGWLDVPLLCTHELDVPGSLRRCIRILIHWNTRRSQREIRHVYVKDAVRLRPDLSQLPPVNFAELESWIAEQMKTFAPA